MNVLHIVRSMDVGGLETVVIGLVDGGREHDIAPYLGCLYELGAQGGDVRTDGTWVGGLEKHGSLKTLFSLCQYLRRNQIDVIHTHNPQPHLFGVLAGIICRVPVVHTKHGRNYPEDAKRVWLNRQLSRFSVMIAAVSEDAARVALTVEKVPEKKVMVVYNGIDTERFAPSGRERGEWGVESGEWGAETGLEKRDGGSATPSDSPQSTAHSPLVIGSVGRLSEDKDYPMLVRSFALMQQQLSTLHSPLPTVHSPPSTPNSPPLTVHSPPSTPNSPPPTVHTQLLLVGDGPDRQLIEHEAQKQGVADACSFAGMQNDVEEWYRKMDVFCLSSVTEGCSMTLLEAGSSGLPSVVTDVGGNRELVADGESGFVVPPGDENAFADALEMLVEDEELRRKQGAVARARVVEQYSTRTMVATCLGLYRESLNRRKRRKRRC